MLLSYNPVNMSIRYIRFTPGPTPTPPEQHLFALAKKKEKMNSKIQEEPNCER